MNELELLRGAEQIALYLYNDKKKTKAVYRLHEGGSIPSFKIGPTICLRPETFMRWLESKEAHAFEQPAKETDIDF